MGSVEQFPGNVPPQEAPGPDPIEIRFDVAKENAESVAEEKEEKEAEKPEEESKEQEDEESEEEKEAELEGELSEAQESLEGEIRLLARANERWRNAMEPLEASAKAAGGRYEGLAGAEGMISSRKKQVETRIESLQQVLEGQKVNLLYMEPEQALEEQQRIIQETNVEAEALSRATVALEEKAENMAADFSATFGTQFMQFENILEPGQELKDGGNAEAIMKRLRQFLDEENPVEGSAGSVSRAVNAYAEKISAMRLPNEIAQRRMQKTFEDTKEKVQPEKKEEPVKEVTLIGAEEEKEEGKGTERTAA